MNSPVVSVIIPTYNEERNISSTIRTIQATDECEVIVVDGGSTDRTIDQARNADQVLQSPLGRAIQQNTGAKYANGEILLFLHADCELQPGFVSAVQESLSASNVAAGCFDQWIDHSARRYRILERGNAWRVTTFGWIYGDQGLFLKRELFENLGGFPQMSLMEDLYFSKRLKKSGNLVLSKHKIKVSARRWEKNGVVRQTIRNWGFVTLAHLGVRPERLASWYGHVRETDVNSRSQSDSR